MNQLNREWQSCKYECHLNGTVSFWGGQGNVLIGACGNSGHARVQNDFLGKAIGIRVCSCYRMNTHHFQIEFQKKFPEISIKYTEMILQQPLTRIHQ
jgi:hypothetical protein